MGPYVTRALVSVDCSLGEFLLEDLSDLKISANKNNQPVKTMNRADAVRGHRSGPAEISATWTVQKALINELDIHTLWRTQETFLMGAAEGPDEGDRFQLTGAKIDSIEAGYSADGEATWEVGLVAQDWRRTS